MRMDSFSHTDATVRNLGNAFQIIIKVLLGELTLSWCKIESSRKKKYNIKFLWYAQRGSLNSALHNFFFLCFLVVRELCTCVYWWLEMEVTFQWAYKHTNFFFDFSPLFRRRRESHISERERDFHAAKANEL